MAEPTDADRQRAREIVAHWSHGWLNSLDDDSGRQELIAAIAAAIAAAATGSRAVRGETGPENSRDEVSPSGRSPQRDCCTTARAEGWRAALNAVAKWYRKEGFADSRDDTDAVRSTMRTIRALKEPGHE